jgi:Tfp pilus assembly protein PilV
MLIEVMISALIVALIIVGTFNGIDASGRAQRSERLRNQATVLAQQDEERLRSLSSSQLASLNETKTTTFQNTSYTVVSKSEFISDNAGEGSCSSTGATADYFQTSSEVSWPGIGSRPKVVQTGLVSPPAGGELMVLVEDGRGGRTSGMSITGTGPAALSGTTAANGCVVFGPLEEGTYVVNAKQTGYVNPDGESEVPSTKRSITVTGQTTVSDPLEFNKAGWIEAKVATVPSTLGGAQTLNVIAEQTGLSAKFRDLLSSEPGYSSGTSELFESAHTFFPFASAYNVYAGTCLANNPVTLGGAGQPAQVEPGAAAKVTVNEPGMIVRFWNGASSASKGTLITSGYKLYVKDTDTGEGNCNNTTYEMKLASSITEAKGSLERPGLPYGKYTVCVVFTKSGSKYHALKEGVENKTTLNGSTLEGPTVDLFEKGPATEVISGSTCP